MMSPVTYLLRRDYLGGDDWWDDESYKFYQSDALADFLADLAESGLYANLREALDDGFAKLKGER